MRAEGVVVGLLISVPAWALIFLIANRAPGLFVVAGLVLLFVAVVGIFSRGPSRRGASVPPSRSASAVPSHTRWE